MTEMPVAWAPPAAGRGLGRLPALPRAGLRIATLM